LHRHGTAFLRNLARDIGLRAGTFTVRSDKGVASVPGAVTLEAEHICVDVTERWPGEGISVLYRSRAGRHDFTSGPNPQWTTMRDLANGGFDGFTAECREMAEAGVRVAATGLRDMRSALKDLADGGPAAGTVLDGEVVEDDVVN